MTVDLGKTRTVNSVVTLGYPAGTEPGFGSFTIQVSQDNKRFLNFTEDGKTKVRLNSFDFLSAKC